jgi:hypothetical protein
LIEKTVTELTEKSKCNHSGAGSACPLHGDADCNSSKQNRKEELMPDELIGTTYEVTMEDGETLIIEKEKGLDGKACWKGYKYAGTKMKGGKKVDDCVKAGYEMEGGVELDEADKKSENKFHKKLDKLVHKTFGSSSDEKKMKEDFEQIEEKKDMPGSQEKIDANKNGKVDAHDFALLRAKKGKKSVKEMKEIAEASKKKVEIEIMPTVDTPSDPEPPTGKKAEKKKMKEEVEPLEEKKLSKAETEKKEKFVKGMKKKFGSMKSKYGEKAKSVMYGAATNMAKSKA